MNDLNASIRALNDTDAQTILAAIAKHRLQPPAGAVTALTPDLTRALTDAVGEEAPAGVATGELARSTLLLLAEEPARKAELQALMANPPAQRLAIDPVSLTVLTTASLVVLQSYVKIEYDKKKGWRVIVEHQPLNKSLLGKVIGMLKRFPGGS